MTAPAHRPLTLVEIDEVLDAIQLNEACGGTLFPGFRSPMRVFDELFKPERPDAVRGVVPEPVTPKPEPSRCDHMTPAEVDAEFTRIARRMLERNNPGEWFPWHGQLP